MLSNLPKITVAPCRTGGEAVVLELVLPTPTLYVTAIILHLTGDAKTGVSPGPAHGSVPAENGHFLHH